MNMVRRFVYAIAALEIVTWVCILAVLLYSIFTADSIEMLSIVGTLIGMGLFSLILVDAIKLLGMLRSQSFAKMRIYLILTRALLLMYTLYAVVSASSDSSHLGVSRYVLVFLLLDLVLSAFLIGWLFIGIEDQQKPPEWLEK